MISPTLPDSDPAAQASDALPDHVGDDEDSVENDTAAQASDAKPEQLDEDEDTNFQDDPLYIVIDEWIKRHDEKLVVIGHCKNKPVDLIVHSIGVCPSLAPKYYYSALASEKWLVSLGTHVGAEVFAGSSGRVFIDYALEGNSEAVHIGQIGNILAGNGELLEWNPRYLPFTMH